MRLRAIGDHVVVKPEPVPEKTRGGLILPETAKPKPRKGKAISVGPGSRNRDGTRTPIEARAGDVVVYGEYSGIEIEVDGEKFVVLNQVEVLATWEE